MHGSHKLFHMLAVLERMFEVPADTLGVPAYRSQVLEHMLSVLAHVTFLFLVYAPQTQGVLWGHSHFEMIQKTSSAMKLCMLLGRNSEHM